jgi:hypothetical protein
MPVSLVDGDSLLAVDIGAASTRAVLFDVVEGQYRFLASGHAPSTVEAPFKDASEGVRNALSLLQETTGRTLLDENRGLITPTQRDGAGVDAFVATMSAGPTLKAVIVGLLPDVSLESARRLTETIYARIVDSIGLGDRRRPDELIDGILRQRPDVVIVTGGTDGGASRSIQKVLEPIGLMPAKTPALFRRQPEDGTEIMSRWRILSSSSVRTCGRRSKPRTSIPPPASLPACSWRSASGRSRGWTRSTTGPTDICCRRVTPPDA